MACCLFAIGCSFFPNVANDLKAYTSLAVANKVFATPNNYSERWGYRSRSTATGMTGMRTHSGLQGHNA